MDKHDISSRRIKSIRAIGATVTHGLGNWRNIAGSKLESDGIIEVYDYFHDKVIFPNGIKKTLDECADLFGNVKTRLEVYLDEPVIFAFDDGCSLEMQPVTPNGLRMSFCAIPNEMTDGINHMEFDIGLFFNNSIAGQSISGINLKKVTQHYEEYFSSKNTPIHDYMKQTCKYIIRLRNKEVCLSNLYGGGFSLSVSNNAAIKCSSLNVPSVLGFTQIYISEGAGHGGALNIGGGKLADENYRGEVIHVDYMIPNLAWELMDKYFDKNLNPDRLFDDRLYEHYDINKYTIDDVIKLGKELYELALLAKKNPFDERFELLFPQSVWKHKEKSKEDYLKENPHALIPEIDYAKRFAERIICLAKNAEGCDCISFCGP